ncbi:SIMPL domain-containing protein [Lederbergia citrea]|uniref:SIMPL domain-containing protein n=1 Tax=Lederbergia citrea TaxID=2833581 RepID=UPI001BC92B53|nr:SIMPL domain-containing protein [Lederbergia citrea]MBS4205529.1 SIMPL domain-containing protein [Lederbergia citrea]
MYEKGKRNVIEVTGEGKVTVQPDQAEITLGASTEDLSLMKAQKSNALIISNIKKALNQIGIRDEQIQTVNYSIYPQYEYIEGKQIFKGYKVEHLLHITVKQFQNAGLVVDTAVGHGANNVSGIKFDTSNHNQYYQQALSLAVINAHQKAETIANTLRVQLIRVPISVTENLRTYGGPIPYQTFEFVKSEAVTPIQPGTMDIISTVTAKFTYD